MRVSDFQAGKTEESKPEVPQAIIDMKKKEEEKKAKKAQIKALTMGGDKSTEVQPPPEDQYTVAHPFLAMFFLTPSYNGFCSNST